MPSAPNSGIVRTMIHKNIKLKRYPRAKSLLASFLVFACLSAGAWLVPGNVVAAPSPVYSGATRVASGTPVTTPPAAKDEPDCTGSDLSKDCQIVTYLIAFINVLSAMVAIVVVGSIIVGGIQYTTAADDPQKVSAAKMRIYNSILAFLFFIFMYAFLQWIVPGGVLNK